VWDDNIFDIVKTHVIGYSMNYNDFDETIDKIKKTRRDTKGKVCQDIRRSGNACGICGSENICSQGVQYCTVCGIEQEYITVERWSYFHDIKKLCKCIVKQKIGKKIYVDKRCASHIGVRKCIDCGAVEGSFCPNCKKEYTHYRGKCWYRWTGEKYCLSCGFRVTAR